MKYSCLIFGEGRRDVNFVKALVSLDKFQYHTKNWIYHTDNAFGSSPLVILDQCKRAVSGVDRSLVLCFIDIDKLKTDFPKIGRRRKAN